MASRTWSMVISGDTYKTPKRENATSGNLHKPYSLNIVIYHQNLPPSLRSPPFPVHPMSLRTRPLNFRHFNVSFPAEHIVQVTLTRTDKLNCIDKTTSREIAEIWDCFDKDESLWVGIITGVGRAFCTGADLHGT